MLLFDTCVVPCPVTPADALGDLALGADYEIYAAGLAPALDPTLDNLPNVLEIPAEILLFPLFLLLAPILAAA